MKALTLLKTAGDTRTNSAAEGAGKGGAIGATAAAAYGAHGVRKAFAGQGKEYAKSLGISKGKLMAMSALGLAGAGALAGGTTGGLVGAATHKNKGEQ